MTGKLFGQLSDQWKDVHLEALTYTFALIAAADRKIAYAETHRFLDVAREHLDLNSVPFGLIAARFDEAVELILADQEEGWRKALVAIRNACEHGMTLRDVIAAARIAIISDMRIEPEEERAIQRLAQELGVDPDGV